MSERKMSEESNKLVEKRRLAALLIQAVNKAEECVEKLKEGFIDLSDAAETRKKIEHLHTEIMEIDDRTNELLNGDGQSITKNSFD